LVSSIGIVALWQRVFFSDEDAAVLLGHLADPNVGQPLQHGTGKTITDGSAPAVDDMQFPPHVECINVVDSVVTGGSKDTSVNVNVAAELTFQSMFNLV